MKRRFTLTTQEFIGAIRRAQIDDNRWPNLCSTDWLLRHAKARDGEVVIETDGENAPRQPFNSLEH